jgi:hypothetical protein
MKRLLTLIVFLSGCSGGDFTSGLFYGVDAPDAGEAHTDSAPFLAGGASGKGGAPGSGGAPELDAGQGSGGSSHGTGGSFQGTGGSFQTGGAPGTGGGSGGTPGTGGVVSTGGTVGTGGASVDAGCALVTHTNGLGQTWQDCVPLSTYDKAQATKACEAWCAVNGGCACQNGTLCNDSHERVFVYRNTFFMSWPWQGTNAGDAVQSGAGCDPYLLIGKWN